MPNTETRIEKLDLRLTPSAKRAPPARSRRAPVCQRIRAGERPGPRRRVPRSPAFRADSGPGRPSMLLCPLLPARPDG